MCQAFSQPTCTTCTRLTIWGNIPDRIQIWSVGFLKGEEKRCGKDGSSKQRYYLRINVVDHVLQTMPIFFMLFCRGWLRNVPRFKTNVHGHVLVAKVIVVCILNSSLFTTVTWRIFNPISMLITFIHVPNYQT